MLALFVGGQEVENSAVMPHVVARRGLLNFQDISREPSDMLCERSHPLPRYMQRVGRDAQNGDIEVACGQWVVRPPASTRNAATTPHDLRR